MSTAGSLGSVAPGRLPAGRSVAALARQYLPALVVLALALVVWELATAGPGRRVLPAPSVIMAGFTEEADLLRRAATATFIEALGGLAIGTGLGVLVAFATARWASAREVLVPIAIASSAIPLIAIAPILNNWFGVLNPVSKMAMAALLVFFPVMINVTRGLVEVKPAALELMRSYAASDWQVLFKVRVPNMLPYFFTALKIGTTLAFIGAIVAEYFGGTSDVLGRVVITSMSSGSFDVAWAGILLGAAGAIFSYLAVAVAERLVIPWYAAMLGGGRA